MLADLEIPVATIGDLLALKLLSRNDDTRPTDLADLRSLRTVATDDDWAIAWQAVGDIEARGFARGRDLRGALEHLRSGG